MAVAARLPLIVAISVAAIAIYGTFLAFYRLYHSPLAKIPGPKLAALTRWFDAYYEIYYGEGGQFIWQYRKWHEQYGPIVRIGPDEVHIQDTDFYFTLFSSPQKLDKLKRLENRFNSNTSMFSTPKHELHRMRRSALNPFFSTRKIALYAPVIQNRMNRLCDRLEEEYSATGRILVLDDMWACMTSDTIIEYCFGEHHGDLELPDFRSFFNNAIFDLTDGIHVATHFSWIVPLGNSLPLAVVKTLQPAMASEVKGQIAATFKFRNAAKEEKPGKTVFAALLDSDLPPEELSVIHLEHEALAVVTAGVETTKRALSVACFHILDNAAILARLREELFSAIPDAKNPPPLEAYEKLPYLGACVEEALRLSYGVTQRLTRTSATQTFIYQGYALPPGTAISASNYSVSHDEEIFPNSFTFRPERWLHDARAPDGKPLSRYMVSFGKGTRSCLGMALAYTEMYIALATIFRRCEFELWQTTREVVDCARDMIVPRPKRGTLGVRVKVK